MTFSSQTVSLRKAGQILGRSNPFMQKLAAKGYLRTVKVGERYLVHLSEIERFQREGNYIEKGNSNDSSEGEGEDNKINEADGTPTGIRPIKPEEIKQPNQKGGYSLEEAEGGGISGAEGNRTNGDNDRGSNHSSTPNTSTPVQNVIGAGQGDGTESQRDSSGELPSSGEVRSSQASAPVVDEPYPAYLKEIIKRGAI